MIRYDATLCKAINLMLSLFLPCLFFVSFLVDVLFSKVQSSLLKLQMFSYISSTLCIYYAHSQPQLHEDVSDIHSHPINYGESIIHEWKNIMRAM